MFILYLIAGVMLYGVIDWKLAVGKKIFGRFNFQNRMQQWGIAIGGTIVLSIVDFILRQLMKNAGINQVVTDVVTCILFGIGLSFFLTPLFTTTDIDVAI